MYVDVGRMTNKPEVRYTQSGKAVCNFTIAVDDLPDKDGNRHSNFIDCVTWGKLAEMIAKNFTKGERIFVSGDLKTRTYEKDGVKRKITEVLVDRIKFCETKASSANRAQAAAEETPLPEAPTYDIGNEPSFAEISADEDLPF